MSRYEKASTLITSNRPFEDWANLLGDVVVATPLLDRLTHHGHVLEVACAAGVAKRASIA